MLLAAAAAAANGQARTLLLQKRKAFGNHGCKSKNAIELGAHLPKVSLLCKSTRQEFEGSLNYGFLM